MPAHSATDRTSPRASAQPHLGPDAFADLVAHIPGTVFRSEAAAPWHVRFMSGTHEVSTGRGVHEYLADGELYLTLIHPDDRPGFTQTFSQALAERRPYVAEYRVLHRDGSWHWARQHATGVYAEDATALFVDGVIFDISAERREQERVRKLANALPVAVYQSRLDENDRPRMLYISDAIEQLTGYSAQAVMADLLILFSRIHPKDLPGFVAADAQAFHARAEFAQEVRFFRADGQERWMSVKSSPYTTEDGEIAYQGFMEDITERKLAEERVRASESFLQQIFDTSNVAIFLVNPQGIITRANRKMAQMFGCTMEQLTGAPYVSLVDPAERQASHQKMLALLASDIDSVNLERLYLRHDGKTFWGNLTGKRFNGSDGTEYGLIGVIMDVSERRRAEEEVRNLAFYDPLTNLPNRRLLLDHLQTCIDASSRNGLYGALVFIDLDNFKTLNDSLGHDVGDQLLRAVAGRLQSVVRKGDTVARLGGDEFVVVLGSLDASALIAARMANGVGLKIIEQMNSPYELQHNAVRSTPSLGIALFRGNESNIDELLKHADLAMYQAKTGGRNTLRFFDPEMQERINARALIESELYDAMEKRQFLVYLQPQVNIYGDCIGAEALVRWNHPVKGIVSPTQFIAISEETGQIRAIGHWVLHEAMRLQRRWQASIPTRDIVVAINISARQFHLASFVNEIEQLLESTGADPSRLQFELTESVLLNDADDAIAKMLSMQALGIGFALDDFGTGYSSLAYLKRLPLRQMKIDQSFVRDILSDPNDLAICRSIIVLAASLGLHVIAEGVETREQWELLRAEGCQEAQGFLFARPMPEDEFVRWLSAGA